MCVCACVHVCARACVGLHVPGCCLAQVLFPPFPFQHAVETEGLAKVALAMGYQAWGMPLVEVEHK